MLFVKSCLLLLFALLHTANCAWPGWPSKWTVTLIHNGPIVAGNTITFRCVVTTDTSSKPKEDFKYIWEDNAVPQHFGEFESTSNEFEWNITYPANRYYPGVYEVQVKVERKISFLYIPISSERVFFNITGFLNGALNLTQHQKEIAQDKYVAWNQELTHEVALNAADDAFLKKNATDIEIYSFIDCQLVNVTKGLSFKHNYTDLNAEHLIEVLVIASFDPPVVVPTTPAPPNGTTTTTTSAPTPSIDTVTQVNSTLPIENSTSSNSVLPSSTPAAASQTTVLPTSTPVSSTPSTTLPPIQGFPYVCNNSSQVSPDLSKTYGYFSKKIKVEAAVSNVKTIGNVWLKHGDMLELEVKCNGTGPFSFCYQYVIGPYNVTGDESCVPSLINTRDCVFPLGHYFSESQEYTLLIVLANNVGRVVTPVGVNIYQVTKHAQLSVVVIPIVFLSLAVFLIVFGLAYYVQSRNRFVIETADFDFSNTSTDLEYKTFRERLREALSAAINNTEDLVEEDSVWSPPGQSSGRRYGSMQ